MRRSHGPITLAIVLLLASLPVGADTSAPATGLSSVAAVHSLRFEPTLDGNGGNARYQSRGRDHVVFLTADGISLKLAGPTESGSLGRDVELVGLRFVGAQEAVQLRGEDPLPGSSNYFVGAEPAAWRVGVQQFSRVRYTEVYPQVDVVAYGREGHLEYDFVLRPGADPTMIRLAVEGAGNVSVDEDGRLVAFSPLGRRVVQHKPVVYQETERGRTAIPGRYNILDDGGVVFDIGEYDRTRELVIDPVVGWATYLGGRDRDNLKGVAVDTAGNVYVVGSALSDDYPVVNPIQTTQDVYAVVVSKFNSTGDTLLYSTYIDGRNNDHGEGIAVDASGAAFVVGRTFSDDFPTVNAFQGTAGASSDAFVCKLSPDGSQLVYSTYLGGDDSDSGYGIALDSSGRVCVTGQTESSDFPRQSAFQNSHGGGRLDAFVTKLNAAGNGLVYSSYLGGRSDDAGWAVAMQPGGNAYVGGETASDDFRVSNAYQANHGGGSDGFVAKINPNGTMAYSTYLGTSSHDRVFGTAVDGSGRAVVTGHTSSDSFPTVNPFQANRGGNRDAFVVRFNTAGSDLLFSSYLGGGSVDEGLAVTTASNGDIYVVGNTSSSDFPVQSPHQGAFGGGTDAFVAMIDGSDLTLEYSSYLGGSGDDDGAGIAVDAAMNAHVCGSTESTNFPTLSPFQAALGDGQDGFVVKIRGGGVAQGYSYVAGALAHATGAQGTNWRSNVAAVNPTNTQASLTLTFVGGDTRVRSATLGPRATNRWDDILVSLFGYASSASVSGSLLITSDQPLRISVRTFNAPGSGTYGQYLPALEAGDAVTAGTVGIVPMMEKSGGFRTNLGAQNVSETACQVRFVLYNRNGQKVGNTLTRNLAAWQWLQISDVFAAAGAGNQSLAYATVEVLTAGAEVWFYASLVDNVSGDGTTIPVLW